MKPVALYTDHDISQRVCEAWGDRKHVREGLDARDPIVYGVLRGCGEIIRLCEALNRDWWHIDNGYFRPGHFDGYYRVTLNGFQATEPFECPPDRFEKLGTVMEPWRKLGSHVLIVPPSPGRAVWYGFRGEDWVSCTINDIRRSTDRKIAVKTGPKGNMQQALENAWCVVTFDSQSATHALREGVPCIVTGEHIAESVSWDFPDIESPKWPERDPWAHWVAYNQFTLDEMRSGEAWNLLKSTAGGIR